MSPSNCQICRHISVVMVGGILRQVSSAFVGPHAEQVMRSLHADHCFLGTVGLDLDVGLTTLDIMEAQLNQVMIRAARQVTVLADSSKFGERSLAVISDFSNVKRLITDYWSTAGSRRPSFAARASKWFWPERTALLVPILLSFSVSLSYHARLLSTTLFTAGSCARKITRRLSFTFFSA